MLNLFALYTNSYPEYEYFKQPLFKTTIDPIKTLVHIFSKRIILIFHNNYCNSFYLKSLKKKTWLYFTILFYTIDPNYRRGKNKIIKLIYIWHAANFLISMLIHTYLQAYEY